MARDANGYQLGNIGQNVTQLALANSLARYTCWPMEEARKKGKRWVISTREEMRDILDEITSGEFAREWILENQAGRPVFNALHKAEQDHLIEKVGKKLRKMMSWIDAKEV